MTFLSEVKLGRRNCCKIINRCNNGLAPLGNKAAAILEGDETRKAKQEAREAYGIKYRRAGSPCLPWFPCYKAVNSS